MLTHQGQSVSVKLKFDFFPHVFISKITLSKTMQTSSYFYWTSYHTKHLGTIILSISQNHQFPHQKFALADRNFCGIFCKDQYSWYEGQALLQFAHQPHQVVNCGTRLRPPDASLSQFGQTNLRNYSEKSYFHRNFQVNWNEDHFGLSCKYNSSLKKVFK